MESRSDVHSDEGMEYVHEALLCSSSDKRGVFMPVDVCTMKNSFSKHVK